MTPDYPSFRDLYESAEKLDEKIDAVKDDVADVRAEVSRVKYGLAFLALLVAAPKLGAPSAGDVIAVVIQHFA